MQLNADWKEKKRDTFTVLKPGKYDFEVIEATEKVSSAGNQMIELKLKVFDGQGGTQRLMDWLVLKETVYFKIVEFCKAVNQGELLDGGQLNAVQCLHRTGVCKVGVETEVDDMTKQQRTRNRVEGYVPGGGITVPDGDNIPF